MCSDNPTQSELKILEGQLARKRMPPIDRAKAYRRLKDGLCYTQAELAKALGLSQSTVSKVLGLLKLPLHTQFRVNRGEIKLSAAYQIPRKAAPKKTVNVPDVPERRTMVWITKKGRSYAVHGQKVTGAWEYGACR